MAFFFFHFTPLSLHCLFYSQQHRNLRLANPSPHIRRWGLSTPPIVQIFPHTHHALSPTHILLSLFFLSHFPITQHLFFLISATYLQMCWLFCTPSSAKCSYFLSFLVPPPSPSSSTPIALRGPYCHSMRPRPIKKAALGHTLQCIHIITTKIRHKMNKNKGYINRVYFFYYLLRILIWNG